MSWPSFVMSPPQYFVGIDVAKAQRDIALRLTGERWAVTNDDAGVAALITRLQEIAPQLIVLEAIGGSQRAVVAALVAADLPIVVVNPRQARDFAKPLGNWRRWMSSMLVLGAFCRCYTPCNTAPVRGTNCGAACSDNQDSCYVDEVNPLGLW